MVGDFTVYLEIVFIFKMTQRGVEINKLVS